MNEGKPTKPKWWNRPRLQDPAEGAAPEPGTVSEAVSGDPAVGLPEAAAGGSAKAADDVADPAEAADTAPRSSAGTASEDDVAPPARGGAVDGDFELDRPTGSGGETAASDADVELGRPDGAGGERAAVSEGAVELGSLDGVGGERAAVSDGDFELRSPGGVGGARAGVSEGDVELGSLDGAGSERAGVSEGAVELGSPGGAGSEGVASSEGKVAPGPSEEVGTGPGALPEGDFELRAPRDAAVAEAVGSPAIGSASDSEAADQPRTGGDFELDRPAAAPVAQVDSAAVPAPAEPATERPMPLHDRDPYSTPPYGEPGPWAPAPPVQHPVPTSAQGTAIPTPRPGQGAQVLTPPTSHGAPALTPPLSQGAATQAHPAHGASTPVSTAVHGMPAPTPIPGPPAPEPTPIPGTPVPEVSAPQGAPAVVVPQAMPAPGAPVPTGPVPAVSAPQGAPAVVVPQAMPAPGAPVPTGPAPHTSSGLATPPPAPWQNYDPWAAAPLQQNGAVVEGKDKRRRRVKRGLVGGAVVLALVSGGVGGAIGAYLERNGGVGAVELPQAGKEPAGRAPDSVSGIAARALPSVVTLHVTGADESGTGTGFVLDDQGHILTNNHVVEPAAGSSGSLGQISVTFNSGDTAKATVVGRDSGYDLAVVKVSNVRGLKPMPLGNSDNVRVGDPVVAIGAPFDLEGTVTSGIISAKERPITAGGDSSDGSDVSYVDALQTDAPINPGNSGGPLLDSKARVIGINSAIRSADDGSDSAGGQAGSIGLGFAIPVNQAKRVAEELINTGKATHPVIGVTLDMDYTGDGARVGTKAEGGGPAVNKGGPGDKAGIKAGDVITAVDGQRVHSGEELIVKTRAHRPGDRLGLTVRRDGKEKKVLLVLGSSDGD